MTNTSVEARPAFKAPDYYDSYGAAWSDTETLLTFFDPDFQYEDKTSGAVINGHDLMRRFMRVYHHFSPKCTVDFTKVVTQGTVFAAKWDWVGNDESSLILPDGATAGAGKPFNVPGMSICTVNDAGLITSHADYWDSATLLRQVGVA